MSSSFIREDINLNHILSGIENVFVPIYAITLEEEIIFASEGCAKLANFNGIEEVIGKRCCDVFKSDICHTEKCPLIAYRDNNVTRGPLEVDITLPNGEKKYIRVYHAPIISDGVLKGIVEILEDFTEVKESSIKILNMITSLASGDLSKLLDTQKLHRDFVEIGKALNTLNISLDLGLRNICDTVKQIAEGRFGEVEWEMPGIYREIANNINQAIQQIDITLHQIQEVCTAIRDGDLSKVIDVSKLEGVFADISERINEMSISLELGLINISDTIRQIAEGRFGEVEWEMPGIYREIANNINQAIQQIDITLHQMHDVFYAIINGDMTQMVDVSKLEGVFADIGKRINAAIKHAYEVEMDREKLNKLIKVLSEINELVARERCPEVVLDAVCKKLTLLYDAVFTSLKKDGELVPVRSEGIDIASIGRSIKHCPSILDAMKGEKARMRMNDRLCRHCTPVLHKYVLSIPLLNNKNHGVITIHSSSEFSSDEITLLERLSRNIAFALSAYEVEKDRKKAFERLAANLTHFENSADRLRNPLAIIIGSLELRNELGYERVLEIIDEHAKRIRNELDEMREEEIRTYILTERVYSTLIFEKKL
jgi:CRISPR/Cas system CSM-associated protein Csm2 small subunit